MKNKKIIIIVSIILLIVIAAVSVILVNNYRTASTLEGVTYTVRSETYENQIDVSGYIDAAETQTLYVASDATVTAINVSEGDFVKAGDVLVQFTDSEEQYDVAEEEYNIEQAEISGSVKEVALMKKKLEMLQDDLKDKQIIATFDGIVASLEASVGDYYEAADTIGTLINRKYLTADVEVVETDVSKLEVGQKITLDFPAYPDEEIEGVVYSWPAIAEISDSGSTVVMVEMRILDAPDEILPNYSFTGTIAVSEAQDILLVERYAIGHDEETGAFVEVVEENNSTTKIPVKVESYGTNYVKILSGVEEGAVLTAQIENTSGSAVEQGGVMSGMIGGGAAGGPPAGGPQ
ncbi:MAG: efflux RND transporter periplasmic adaptor subunit [Spirochaetales bacterium]|uniref:Efflux RND transporter periplasmic adaptor subunit n=1 Tax=Candidatus Thalassospirochaeta sargassi TaxID=3119039 RepID=A0AAJ1IFS0_9SPIO|nr:efflux RND transporter periplasmic adaptor subunit [Spirochaetales bacterium]